MIQFVMFFFVFGSCFLFDIFSNNHVEFPDLGDVAEALRRLADSRHKFSVPELENLAKALVKLAEIIPILANSSINIPQLEKLAVAVGALSNSSHRIPELGKLADSLKNHSFEVVFIAPQLNFLSNISGAMCMECVFGCFALIMIAFGKFKRFFIFLSLGTALFLWTQIGPQVQFKNDLATLVNYRMQLNKDVVIPNNGIEDLQHRLEVASLKIAALTAVLKMRTYPTTLTSNIDELLNLDIRRRRVMLVEMREKFALIEGALSSTDLAMLDEYIQQTLIAEFSENEKLSIQRQEQAAASVPFEKVADAISRLTQHHNSLLLRCGSENIGETRNGLNDMLADLAATKRRLDVYGVPTGTVIAFAGWNPPPGYLLCDGREVGSSQYPELFGAIGHIYGGAGNQFKVPDFRGMFLRGVGGNAPPLGTAQGDAIRNIYGGASAGWTGREDWANAAKPDGAFAGSYADNSKEGADCNHGWRLKFDASLVVPTANENRPVNYAVMYCIKY